MAEDVFISYARADLDAANAVRQVLERNGISCWMDVEGIQTGEAFGEEIANAIETCKVVVFILSERSQQSRWTRKEVTTAINEGKPVLPIAIEKCDVIAPFSFYFSDVQRGTVYQDVAASLDGLVRDVKSLMHVDDDPGAFVPQEAVSALSHKKGRPSNPVILGVCMAMLVVVCIGFGLRFIGVHNAVPHDTTVTDKSVQETPESQPTALVYASDCFSYRSAGAYNSTENLGFYERAQAYDNNEIWRAFSILSFVRNESSEAARVESITLEVLDLQAIEVPDVRVDAAFNGDTLLVYCLNDGWSQAEGVSLDVYFTAGETRVDVPEVALEYDLESARSLAPGEVARFWKIVLNRDQFMAHDTEGYSGEYDLILHIDNASTGEAFEQWPVVLDDQGFRIRNGAGGFGEYDVTLFAVLDVDAHPTSIRFTSAEATPRVEDTFRIETVIAPTKSCRLTCKDVYSVNGSLQETPEYELTVKVPVMQDQVFGETGKLTKELAQRPDMGPLAMQEVVDTYRYDPASIKPE